MLCAEALNCVWDTGTDQLDMCNEAHHTNACTHTHTHTNTAVARSGAAEFITTIYYLLLYQRNVIPLSASDAPHCHYGPLWGGDRDGAEGVDKCWCGARCHYSVYRVESAKRFPQNGRSAARWLRLRGANDSHLTIGTKC